MNIFNRIIFGDFTQEKRLGYPLNDDAAVSRRKNIMSGYTGGKGFRTPALKPRVDSQGMTRGDRKRAIRAACNAAERKRQETEAKIIVRRTGVPFAVAAQQFGSVHG